MSVAALSADTSVKAVAPRADKNAGKAGDDGSSDFKNMVKDETGSDKAAARSKSETGETAGAGDDRGIWRRYASILDGASGKLGAQANDAEEAGADSKAGEGSEEDTAAEEAGNTASIIGAVAATPDKAEVKTKATGQNAETVAQSKSAPQGADAEAKSVTPDAEKAEPSTKAATPTVLPAEASAVAAAQRTDALQRGANQTARQAMPEQAQGAGQQTAQEIVASKGETENDASGGDDRQRGNGQNREMPTVNQNQNGNRLSGVAVVSQHVTPAMPAQSSAMSVTSAVFANALADSMSGLERAEATAQTTLAQSATKTGPITTLKIQLQPLELGMVTARLSGTQAQLSVEITVENAEARHRLTTDSDTIVTALRGLGIEVDRITVQQSQSNSAATPNNAGRGGEFAQSDGNRGSQQEQASRQGGGNGNRNDAQGGSANAQADGSGGVYI